MDNIDIAGTTPEEADHIIISESRKRQKKMKKKRKQKSSKGFFALVLVLRVHSLKQIPSVHTGTSTVNYP
jgi:hypothetical protein